jgi:hypothetical protein
MRDFDGFVSWGESAGWINLQKGQEDFDGIQRLTWSLYCSASCQWPWLRLLAQGIRNRLLHPRPFDLFIASYFCTQPCGG